MAITNDLITTVAMQVISGINLWQGLQSFVFHLISDLQSIVFHLISFASLKSIILQSFTVDGKSVISPKGLIGNLLDWT